MNISHRDSEVSTGSDSDLVNSQILILRLDQVATAPCTD
jgi:hypothetical protein